MGKASATSMQIAEPPVVPRAVPDDASIQKTSALSWPAVPRPGLGGIMGPERPSRDHDIRYTPSGLEKRRKNYVIAGREMSGKHWHKIGPLINLSINFR